MGNPGWRRVLAGGLMALGALTAPSDLAAPDDPLADAEAALAKARLGPLLAELRRTPLYRQARAESAWRARTRQAHRAREAARTLLASAGAGALAFGILARRRWDAPLLGAGVLVWGALYALDLGEGKRLLGGFPVLFASGQGLNLLFLAGLWLWLRRDARMRPTGGPP